MVINDVPDRSNINPFHSYNRVAGPGYHGQSYPSTSQSNLIGAYGSLSLGPPQTNAYQPGLLRNPGLDLPSLQPVGVDYNNLTLPALSTTSSPSQVSTTGSPIPLYPQPGLPQLYPLPSVSSGQTNPNVDPLNVSSVQHAEAKWPAYNHAAPVISSVNANPQYPFIVRPDVPEGYPNGPDYDSDYYNSRSESSSLSPPADPSPSPEEAALVGSSFVGVPTTTGSGQWSNTSVVTNSIPDPIEPFFKTIKERDLVCSQCC